LLSACAVGIPKPATHATGISATLNGDVFSNVEGDTAYWFRYGETTAYGRSTPERAVAVADDEPHPVSESVGGLSPGVTYHWQMCVRDQGEDPPRDICSKDQAFKTSAGADSISASFTHTCAILRNGSVRCWGSNWAGQLGLGHTNYIGSSSGTLPDSVPPVDLGEGRTALQISAGWDHTCALLDNHSVLCWGSDAGGALGQGNQEDIGDDETPGSVGPVDLGDGHTAVAVAAGPTNHSCAILDDGSVKCWGAGTYGQRGYGNTTNVHDPSTIGPVNLGAGRTAVAIDTAAGHTCVIVNSGDVMCWGLNFAGLLGYGYSFDEEQNIGDDETPDAVGTIDLGAHTALQITGQDHNACALLDDHTVRCWGSGWRGKSGYPGGDDYHSPPTQPIDLGAGRTALSIDGGADHACAVLDDHSIRCFGFGNDGQLGYGNTEDVGNDEPPGAVGPVNLGPGRTATEVSAARWHSCALLDTGDVRCWGNGSFLGYGNTSSIGDNETPDTAGPVSLGN
jgi:alpha-tubulin suppressor-like RCC1 family protein